MLDAFSTAFGTALTAMKADLEGAIGDNLTIVLPLTLGLLAIGIVWGVVAKFVRR